MKELRLSFHSIVDVITNSSSVVYTSCTSSTIEHMKEIVNSILKAGGSDKVADDLYKFKIVPSENAQERAMNYIDSHPESVGAKKINSWKEAEKYVDDMMEKDTLKKFIDDNSVFDYDNFYTDALVMKCKTPEGEDFIKNIYSLFSHEGSYDG